MNYTLPSNTHEPIRNNPNFFGVSRVKISDIIKPWNYSLSYISCYSCMIKWTLCCFSSCNMLDPTSYLLPSKILSWKIFCGQDVNLACFWLVVTSHYILLSLPTHIFLNEYMSNFATQDLIYICILLSMDLSYILIDFIDSYLSIYLSIYLSVYLYINLSIYLYDHLHIYNIYSLLIFDIYAKFKIHLGSWRWF